ncbi:MAG TPA: 4-oxalocrotonate tautomerase family protein [Polyangiaceae bacterium]|nr:4-oxalocrotonate tautomerase family protein [Polyangiaceae bacterium]
MPIVHIYLTPPLDDEGAKRELMRSVTEAVGRSLGKPPEQTRVLLFGLPEADWAVAGEPVASRRRGGGGRP